MASSLRRRTAQAITIDTDHRIKMYSLAAAAASVGVLALAQPAQGEVIVTKKNIPINVGSPAFVDLNKDGIADFELSFQTFSNGQMRSITLAAIPLAGGEVVGGKGSFSFSPGAYASALARGAKIGPSAHFSSSHGQITIERSARIEGISGGNYYGKWYGLKTNRGSGGSFLGLKFLIKGETHYGWIRLTVGVPGAFSPEITGYAYETIPNKRLEAGIPSKTTAKSQGQQGERSVGSPSLGMLALGADGLAFWRR
jgi:hypothetical protein